MKEVKLLDSSFILQINKLDDSFMDFDLYEVSSWKSIEEIGEVELYLKGTIKWDGCSHLYFGLDDNNGYIHLCGKYHWEKHNKIMTEVYKYAQEHIEDFDEDEKM